jgi:hypothetical protein
MADWRKIEILWFNQFFYSLGTLMVLKMLAQMHGIGLESRLELQRDLGCIEI